MAEDDDTLLAGVGDQRQPGWWRRGRRNIGRWRMIRQPAERLVQQHGQARRIDVAGHPDRQAAPGQDLRQKSIDIRLLDLGHALRRPVGGATIGMIAIGNLKPIAVGQRIGAGQAAAAFRRQTRLLLAQRRLVHPGRGQRGAQQLHRQRPIDGQCRQAA